VERQVQERTTQLEHEIVERVQAEKEIQRLNAVLEKRVIERTTELETAIKELEPLRTRFHTTARPLRASTATLDPGDEYAPSWTRTGIGYAASCAARPTDGQADRRPARLLPPQPARYGLPDRHGRPRKIHLP